MGYFDFDEIIPIVFFIFYWSFLCATEMTVYLISRFVYLRSCFDKQFTVAQNCWNLAIRYKLRDRLVALIWVLLITTSVITIPNRLATVLAVGALAALGYLYQFIHHCR